MSFYSFSLDFQTYPVHKISAGKYLTESEDKSRTLKQSDFPCLSPSLRGASCDIMGQEKHHIVLVTLGGDRFYCHHLLKGDVHQGVRDLQIIILVIWKDGPRDRRKVKQLIEKLNQW